MNVTITEHLMHKNPVHQMTIAYVGGSIWQLDRENQIFLGDALSPECRCFLTHFFHSLRVEKFLAAITAELAKDTVSSTAHETNLMRQLLGSSEWVQVHWQWYCETDSHLRKRRSSMF